MWEFRASFFAHVVGSLVATAGGLLIYLATRKGNFIALDAMTGKPWWQNFKMGESRPAAFADGVRRWMGRNYIVRSLRCG